MKKIIDGKVQWVEEYNSKPRILIGKRKRPNFAALTSDHFNGSSADVGNALRYFQVYRKAVRRMDEAMNLIIFQFESISIHVIPSSDKCFIYRYGNPIWSGSRDKLIEILEAI